MRKRFEVRGGKAVAAAATLLTAAALAAGCASGGAQAGVGAANDSAGLVGDQTDSGDPVSGGTLTYAGYSFPSNLDPAGPGSFVAGSTGGTEMASIYDTLMRYDVAEDEYVPQLAESLEHSEDYLTWTLALRDGVEFSDGTPVDAAAVVASINRYNAEEAPHSQEFESAVESVRANGPREVVFSLTQRWNELPAALTFGHGMVLAPAAYADEDAFVPIGAGPFTVASFAPDSKLTLSARDDYWDGAPNLDSVEFVAVADGQGRIESLKSGDVDMAFLREPENVARAKGDFPGYFEPLSLGSVVEINNREGHPGSRATVRKALAHAINPEFVNDRAFSGSALATTKVFPEWSQWHNDAPAIEYDPERAKDLLRQAKADGYDGTIRFLSVNDPMWRNIAISIQTALNSVGFEATVDYVPTVTDKTKKVYVDHDYDITYSSYSVADAAPLMRIDASLNSGSAKNVVGYKSPEFDAKLKAVRHSTSDEEEQASLAAVEQQMLEDLPYFSWASGANFVAWNGNVHGAVPNNDGIMMLGNAWIE